MTTANNTSTARCLGLIGGLGVGATVHYYRALAKAHEARGYVLNLVMVHADMPRVLSDAGAGEKARLAEYLAGLIRRMASAGAESAVIPAMTPHICARELEELSPIPVIDLIEAMAEEAQARGHQRVSIFGTRFTIESRMFGRMPQVEIVLPRPDEITLTHDTYMEMASAGCGTKEQYQRLRSLALELIERGQLDAILLAGTDLSLVFNESNTDFPHVDGTQAHLDAIMRVVCGGVPR